jgi:hypothetical protein
MGGREAIRGFAVQTLICLLESMERDVDWTAVTIEPDSANDKVDILWEYEGGRRKAVQVKSSQNPIGKGQIASWCKDLEKEAADEYELRLAGPLKTGALSGDFGKVNVPTPTSIVISDLSDQAVTKLDRYLERSGIDTVPASIRVSLIDICSARLIDGSSTGKRLKRLEFDGWLLHWITAAYPDALVARLSSNCEVLWSMVRIGSPPTGRTAFELTMPLTFYNSGRGAAVVEWVVIMVESTNRRMIYGSRMFDRNGNREPFSEFAVGPGLAVERSLVFQPFDRDGFAADTWPPGDHRLSLRVKFSTDGTPRLIKTATVNITGDHMALLNASSVHDMSVSTMEDYVFAL